MEEVKIDLALSFDDVTLVPRRASFIPQNADISTMIAKGIKQNIPLISAAMDTITESKMAIVMAQFGGSGVIHRNLSIERQVEEVRKVKKDWNLVIEKPVTVSPNQELRDVKRIMIDQGISGLPVIDNGFLVGVITKKDTKYCHNLDTCISGMMTKKEDLVCIEYNPDFSQRDYFDKAEPLMLQHKKDKLLIIEKREDNYILKGLITFQDIEKRRRYKNACLIDERLICGAAIGCNLNFSDPQNDLNRAKALIDAGADYLVVDSSHGHSQGVLNILRELKQVRKYTTPIIAGNICTGAAARDLIEAGADGIKVGVGPGSICTTRAKTGAGIPQITSTHQVALVAQEYGIPVITDGGFNCPGDLTKAIAAGASAVMTGSLLGGTDETPGKVMTDENGEKYKSYRGMGTIEAMMAGSADRYKSGKELQDFGLVGPWEIQPLEQGVPKRVQCIGPAYKQIQELTNGLKHGMGLSGTENLTELRKLNDFHQKFKRVTIAGKIEGGVH